jgi:hypothetical protein
MLLKIKSPVGLRLLLVLVLLVFVTGCSRSTQHVGTYSAEIKAWPHYYVTTLELKEAAVGVWRLGDDEVTFSWYVKGNELRLNTKSGGVIVGSLDGEDIRVTLPGFEELLFRKVK